MAGDFSEIVPPVGGGMPVDPVREQPPVPLPRRRGKGINGTITAVRRGLQHTGEDHQLDVTVGGDEHTEIILRVPRGGYENLTGRHAVLYVEEE